MERTIRRVLSMHFASYAQEHRMPRYVHRAAQQLQRCRTAAMGGHVEACPQGHFERKIFHSCRHRLCPQCNALPREQWLMRMRERLIDCPHHHLIFTLPHDLHELWRWNRTWFTQALFATVAATLRELLEDERYLGAQAGFISALHTWGRSLSFHPHIHCLITDGGVDQRGQWRTPRKSCFLPARVVMALFRGKFLGALRNALANNTVILPPDLSQQRGNNLLNRLGRVKWNVHLRERYEHGQGVVTYLARYLKGGVLNNRQLVELNEQQIRFRYYPHRTASEKSAPLTLKLKPEAFISRYLQHTALPGVPMVRHYGVYANANTQRLARARAHHCQSPAPEAARPLRCAQYLQRIATSHTSFLHCPTCHAELSVRPLSPLPRPP
jgi:Putative transposase/Transposase zinc-binding domain